MYIRKVELENIKGFEHLDWSLPEEVDSAGWHVVIGDNASGKTTFLQAIATPLSGLVGISPQGIFPLVLARQGQDSGALKIWITPDSNYDQSRSEPEATPAESSDEVVIQIDDLRSSLVSLDFLANRPWSSESAGWFSASFGPMRRFTGGSSHHEDVFAAKPRLAAHLSLFGEDVALTEVETWLERLRFEQLEQDGDHPFLENLRAFVNQPGLLPHQSKLVEISSKGVFFEDGEGFKLPLAQLSDGYRSILSLALELLRLLTIFYDDEKIFGARTTEEQHQRTTGEGIIVDVPGVVLIDEIDAHLHPTWQQRVGHWFCDFFPHIQFIVTTHSPLVCQAATRGSVYQLPSPGSEEAPRFLSQEELAKLLYGDVLDAYGSRAFGEIHLSPQAVRLNEELAALNLAAFDRNLTEEEQTRRGELRKMLPARKQLQQETSSILKSLSRTLEKQQDTSGISQTAGLSEEAQES